MTEIDFGTLVSRVLLDMDYTESNLIGDERHDAGKALQHYKQALVEEIRRVFDEAEAPAPVPREPATCSRCGAVLEREGRFCTACGMSQAGKGADEILEKALANDAGTTPDDPRFRASLARFREEEPEKWGALVGMLTRPAKA